MAINIINHFTASGASQTSLVPTIKIIDPDDGIILTSGICSELSNGFYKYSYEAYDASTDFLYLTDSNSGSSDTKLLAGSNETIIHSTVWDVIVSGLGFASPLSYGDQIQDLFAVNTGRWEISGNDLVIYELDSVTELMRFTLDSPSAPTSRVPQ